MKEEMQTVITRLQALPPEAQSELAPRFNSYLNKLDDMRAAIQRSRESGAAIPLDIEDIKRRGMERLNATKHNGAD